MKTSDKNFKKIYRMAAIRLFDYYKLSKLKHDLEKTIEDCTLKLLTEDELNLMKIAPESCNLSKEFNLSGYDLAKMFISYDGTNRIKEYPKFVDDFPSYSNKLDHTIALFTNINNKFEDSKYREISFLGGRFSSLIVLKLSRELPYNYLATFSDTELQKRLDKKTYNNLLNSLDKFISVLNKCAKNLASLLSYLTDEVDNFTSLKKQFPELYYLAKE